MLCTYLKGKLLYPMQKIFFYPMQKFIVVINCKADQIWKCYGTILKKSIKWHFVAMRSSLTEFTLF